MSARDVLRHLLGLAARFADSDGDGKLEISDIPGALAKAASLQASGLALTKAGLSSFEAIKSAADAGALTSGGVPVTASQVAEAWAAAKVPYSTAADEARAELAKGQP